MKTTLTLDDDLAGILEKRARNTDKPFKMIVNDALRLALVAGQNQSLKSEIRTRPHGFGTQAGIDWNRMNQLTDELECEESLVKKLPSR